jgi:hypothetical protein
VPENEAETTRGRGETHKAAMLERAVQEARRRSRREVGMSNRLRGAWRLVRSVGFRKRAMNTTRSALNALALRSPMTKRLLHPLLHTTSFNGLSFSGHSHPVSRRTMIPAPEISKKVRLHRCIRFKLFYLFLVAALVPSGHPIHAPGSAPSHRKGIKAPQIMHSAP